MPTPIAQLRHDLRTPVNHIIGYSELLGEELADQGMQANEDLMRIRGAADALLVMIDTRLTEMPLVTLDEDKTSTTIPSSLTDFEDTKAEVAAVVGRILVVDDNEDNRALLSRQLQRQGHTTVEAMHGRQAIELLSSSSYDLVLLDVMMPILDGYSALQEIKLSPTLRHIPVIMISALDEIASVVRCIEAGAEDYLPKPFNPTLLRARIGACLEKKVLRDSEREHLRTIEETQHRLADELSEAANYVRSILPEPTTVPFAIDWSYIPSTELGGDSFGYHWIDDEHFALYLLDVCGHGVGASLLSVSAINVLRSGALLETDFRDPGAVLIGLNAAFPMERQNNMYFTIWYGVYHRATRTLRHASGGHPPALLLTPQADGSQALEEIREPGTIIGVMPTSQFPSAACTIPEHATLILLCDGTYEIRMKDGEMLCFEDFKSFIAKHGTEGDFFAEFMSWIASLREVGPLDDDFSFVRVVFDT